MFAVTTEDLERVEAEAEQAQRDLKAAEREYAGYRASPTAFEKHQDAIVAADHIARRAKLLREDWQVQQAVRDRRAAEGEAAAVAMAKDVKGFVSSREKAVSAVVEAVAAMGVALDALGEHDRLVRAAGVQLAGRGLRRVDDEATGAGLDGSVWMRGELWPLVDGGSVLGRLLAGLVAEQYPRHPMARLVWQPYGGSTAGRGRDEVLAQVRAGRSG